ncbi:hypothetical protein ACFYM0_35940 [Streptomyces sp. NPDC006487]|uniref:hypothetical protein n=1 Tax=Streptomyces sp. NPDC006487 TaxID=3364748 RepID=UPI0036A8213A
MPPEMWVPPTWARANATVTAAPWPGVGTVELGLPALALAASSRTAFSRAAFSAAAFAASG